MKHRNSVQPNGLICRQNRDDEPAVMVGLRLIPSSLDFGCRVGSRDTVLNVSDLLNEHCQRTRMMQHCQLYQR